MPRACQSQSPLMYDSIHPRAGGLSVVTLTAITPATPEQRSACASALADVRPGVPISREAALHLIVCADDDLPELLAGARTAKERFKPGVITYSRKVFLPLTNLCRDYCGYCTFRRDPGDPGAHTMSPDEVLAVARAGEKLGCTEALFSLGDKPELLFPEMRETLRHLGYKSTLHYLEAMCELVLRETSLLPHPNPGLLSAEWIARLAAVSPSMGLMLETTNSVLLAPRAPPTHTTGQTPAHHRRCRQTEGSLHHGLAHRNRRISRRPRRYAARDPRFARALRPHPGSDRAKLPRQAHDSHGQLPRTHSRRDAPRRGGSSLVTPQRQYSGPAQSLRALL